MAEIGLFEAMHTIRAIRRFKPDPVPEEAITTILECATRAASGGNRQPWRFIVIRDQASKRQIGEYYKRAFQMAYGTAATPQATLQTAVRRSATTLADHMERVPVLIMVCIQLPEGQTAGFGTGASIYPAVQNLMLAARGLGLGTVLTTLHKRFDKEVKALLGIPNDVETAALIPVGYPRGRFGPTTRMPVSEVAFYERWGKR